MKILLVSPRCPETFWSFSHVLRLVGKRAAFPPLGLLTVAAMLPRSWSLRVVDLNARALEDEDIAWADAVMVSAMLVHEASVHEVIARCHALGKRVTGGGPAFWASADRFPEIDACVVGEAEEVIGEVVADLESGALRARYEAPRRPDVSLTPLPRWDLIDVNEYLTLSVQSSRGCPFDCEFCDITAIYGRVPRVKSPEQVVRELDAVRETGWRGSIFLVDDNFIGHRVKAKAILKAIVEWREARGARNTFITEASLNLVDDAQLLGLMTRAGFKHVFLGIESPDEESLRECNKVQNTRRDLVEAVRTIHRAGIQVMAGFIVGFDADRGDVFERQRRFIQEAGVVTAMVGMLTALPGTRLFARLTREGRLVGSTSGNNVEATLNFEPTMERGVLVEGYRSLVRELYEPRAYYARVRRFLRDYRPGPVRGRIGREDVRALVVSMWVMGVRGRGRWEFWRLVLGTLVRRPRAFGQAVDLAIRGHHYRLVAMGV